MSEPIWSFRSDFRREYEPRIHARWHTFQIAANWFTQTRGRTIVETGCVRNDGWQDGRSTYVLADLAARTGGFLWSVDIEPRCIEIARAVVAPFERSVTFVHQDSVEFFKNVDLPFPIDLLYLDSFDYNPFDPDPSQRHALAEFEAALPKLAPRACVLIDDNEERAGGKGGLLREVLPQRGFVCLFDYFQSCWVRP